MITLPASYFERSAPAFSALPGLGRALPAAAAVARAAGDDLAPDDPARTWIDLATVVGVVDTLGHFLT